MNQYKAKQTQRRIKAEMFIFIYFQLLLLVDLAAYYFILRAIYIFLHIFSYFGRFSPPYRKQMCKIKNVLVFKIFYNLFRVIQEV